VRFLVDAQLPPALARWLREAGHEAQHVDELGWRDASDELIWTHALQLDAVIVT
jgi:predicted nuclease of predicted toxin-antitoxin system